MKLNPRALIQKIAPGANFRPPGVWDFMQLPDKTEQGTQEANLLERLWALAEREAYAAGEAAPNVSSAS